MEIIIIGAGPGGYSAAFEAARYGCSVTLVERERMGGTCLNKGCIPTKTILRSAHIMRDASHASRFGLSATGSALKADAAALRARKESVVGTLVKQLEDRADRFGITRVQGTGRVIDAQTVQVEEADGISSLHADAIILAMGSKPFELPMIDHDLPGVWTSDQAVALTDIPSEATIVGGGVIGVEFASAWSAFGCKVTVIELAKQILPGVDKRVARTLAAALKDDGIDIRTGESVVSVEQSGDRVVATLRDGQTVEGDILLSAAGRVPLTAEAGLQQVGIELDRGRIPVDEYYRTSVAGIYAIGDLVDTPMLAHVAEDEGIAAVRNSISVFEGNEPRETVRYELTPACVYTSPEVATIGLTKDGAKEAGIAVRSAIAKMAGNGRALAEGESEGFVQLVVNETDLTIAGCQIVGPFACEMIHEAAVAMSNKVPVTAVADMMYAHPTVSETIRDAARMIVGD